MRFIRWFTAIGLASAALAQTSPAPQGRVDKLIPLLLSDQQLRGVPFNELIFDATGKKVLPFEVNNPVAGSRDISFRAFYFEPKKSTNKVGDDAVHFVVGFEHAPRDVAASLGRGDSGNDQNTATEHRGYNVTWKFTRWDLVDLSRFNVKLKAEFQGSNRDMYRPEAVVASSAK